MEQARKAKAPAKGWDLAALENERDAAGGKAMAKDAARGKVKQKVAAKPRGRDADRISRLPLEKGPESVNFDGLVLV
jgi:hypothetical protein